MGVLPPGGIHSHCKKQTVNNKIYLSVKCNEPGYYELVISTENLFSLPQQGKDSYSALAMLFVLSSCCNVFQCE